FLNPRAYFLKYILLFISLTSSIKITLAKVVIAIISITLPSKGVVLKTVSKNGTYTINNCSITVLLTANHMPRLAKISLERSEWYAERTDKALPNCTKHKVVKTAVCCVVTS